LLIPHIGYVAEDTYKLFYGDNVKAIKAWLESGPGKRLSKQNLF
jgi:hypothetical protein